MSNNKIDIKREIDDMRKEKIIKSDDLVKSISDDEIDERKIVDNNYKKKKKSKKRKKNDDIIVLKESIPDNETDEMRKIVDNKYKKRKSNDYFVDSEESTFYNVINIKKEKEENNDDIMDPEENMSSNLIDVKKEKRKKSKKRKINDDIADLVESGLPDEIDLMRPMVDNINKKRKSTFSNEIIIKKEQGESNDDIVDLEENTFSNRIDMKKEKRKKSKKIKYNNVANSVESMLNVHNLDNNEIDTRRKIINNSHEKRKNCNDIVDLDESNEIIIKKEKEESNYDIANLEENTFNNGIDMKKEKRKKSKKIKYNNVANSVESMLNVHNLDNNEIDTERKIVNNSYDKRKNCNNIVDLDKSNGIIIKKEQKTNDTPDPEKNMFNNGTNNKKRENKNDILYLGEKILSNDIDVKKKIIDEKSNDVTYLANVIRKKEALSQEDTIHLRTLNVKLIHEVPEQHQIEVRSGTRVPSREEMKQFQAITHIKKGCFSWYEDDTIVHNWKKFCKLHDWKESNFKPFLNLVNNNKKYISTKKAIKNFVQFLANGLPNRTLFSVYQRFKILYSAHVTRKYTEEESEMILDYIDQRKFVDEKRKFVDLAKVLNRTRASVWHHYCILKRKRKREEELSD